MKPNTLALVRNLLGVAFDAAEIMDNCQPNKKTDTTPIDIEEMSDVLLDAACELREALVHAGYIAARPVSKPKGATLEDAKEELAKIEAARLAAMPRRGTVADVYGIGGQR